MFGIAAFVGQKERRGVEEEKRERGGREGRINRGLAFQFAITPPDAIALFLMDTNTRAGMRPADVSCSQLRGG